MSNSMDMNKNLITIVASVGLSALAAFGIVKAATPSHIDSDLTYTPAGVTRTVNLAMSDYPDFTYAAETAVEAVVYVQVTATTPQSDYIDPFFRFFFGDGYSPRERVRQGSGSGVIVREDGYIVTNNHVISGATDIKVTLNNNRTYNATIVGSDPATDVALIKIDAKGLPVLQFADSDKLRLGEWVLAIGSPLGEELRSTITAGIVSAKGRRMNGYDGSLKIESFIQTDAAVNPGNSGGALVNKAGELVGINTAIVSTTGSYTGYSFAVPSNIVHKTVADLIDFGEVRRVRLGVTMTAIDEKMADDLKLSSLDGVYIHEVEKGSSADKAGVKEEDVLVAIDTFKITTPASLQERVNNFHPGDKATLKVIRDGKTIELPVVFKDENPENGSVADDGTINFYGASLKATDEGVLIVSAGSGKLAQAGGMDGFVILYVNDQKVETPEDVVSIAKKSRRSIFIEGLTPAGRPGYFGFGKD